MCASKRTYHTYEFPSLHTSQRVAGQQELAARHQSAKWKYLGLSPNASTSMSSAASFKNIKQQKHARIYMYIESDNCVVGWLGLECEAQHNRLFGVNCAAVIANNRCAPGTHSFTVARLIIVFIACHFITYTYLYSTTRPYMRLSPFWLKNSTCVLESKMYGILSTRLSLGRGSLPPMLRKRGKGSVVLVYLLVRRLWNCNTVTAKARESKKSSPFVPV